MQVEKSVRSRYDTCEVFLPPSVCVVANDHGLRRGWSLDIVTRDPVTGKSYDLRNPRNQKEVKKMISRDRPTVVVVSPPCTAFSIANQGEVDPHTLAGAVEMVRFAMEICELQHRAGRHFVFEQPQSSRAWNLDEVVTMSHQDGVVKTTFHQCMYGLVARDQLGVAPAYKPTSVLTNHPALESVLQKRCAGGHRHVQLVGKRACSNAAVYPRELCAAIVKGTQVIKGKGQETLDAQIKMIDMGLNPATSDDFLFEVEREDMCEEDPSTWEELASQKWTESTWPAEETRDSTSGELLDPKKVHEGCQEELGFMSQMGVWDKVTRERAKNDPEGKIVGTR